jgi:cyclic di-GMP phosphodiesterase
MTYKLLIVDDELANIRLLERLFRDDYCCLTAPSGEEAIKLLDQHDVAVIITDQRMPGMTGLELLKASFDRRPHMVRILLTGYTDIDALVEAVNCGLVYMYVSKPWNNADLRLRITRAIQHYEDNKQTHSLVAVNQRLEVRIQEMKLGFVRMLAGVLKLRDEYSYAHGSRVSKYATVLGEHMNLGKELLEALTAAAFLHALGVVGISDELLNQSGSQPTGSVPVLQSHPGDAAKILSTLTELGDIADIIRYQNENYDGSGHPIGLAGEQIPLTSRIIRVASEYDLLTKPRVSGERLNHSAAMEVLKKASGRTLDGLVVQALEDLPAHELDDLRELNSVPVRPELITYAVH